MSLEVLLATAFVIGLVHSVEPDHVVAVTAFVTRRPEPRGALGFAVRWGLGHALAILLIGTVLVFAGLEVPAGLEASLHAVVGAVLLALGGWVLWHALGRGTYDAFDGERRAGQVPDGWEERGQKHGVGLVGALHGMAGTGAAVALIPIGLSDSVLAGAGYLGVFGAGTVIGMALYAFVVGQVFDRARRRSSSWPRGMAVAVGAMSVAVGMWWLADLL